MTTKEQFDFFINDMLDNAVSDFKHTKQYALLKEKLDKMDSDCEGIFDADELGYAEECFGLLLDAADQQEAYVYRKGWRDCITILKELGVLA